MRASTLEAVEADRSALLKAAAEAAASAVTVPNGVSGRADAVEVVAELGDLALVEDPGSAGRTLAPHSPGSASRRSPAELVRRLRRRAMAEDAEAEATAIERRRVAQGSLASGTAPLREALQLARGVAGGGESGVTGAGFGVPLEWQAQAPAEPGHAGGGESFGRVSTAEAEPREVFVAGIRLSAAAARLWEAEKVRVRQQKKRQDWARASGDGQSEDSDE
jgi:hypothetical protein